MKNRILGYSAVWGSRRAEGDATTPPRPSASASSWRQSLESFAVGHPVASVTTALCVGVLIGWFIKRR